MFYINAVLHINAVLRVLQCFAKKNCASHDCSASHHCRLVSSLFEIRHAKTSLVQTCHKNEIRLHIPPFKLAASGDVQDKTQNSSTCHTNFLGKIMQHAGQKKRLFGFGCSMRHATKTQTCSGVLSSSTYCGQNRLCQLSVVRTS